MAECSPEQLVAAIHAAAGEAVAAITGGGSRAIGELLGVPGGSRTLLEAIVPYSAAALVDFLRARPEQFCSARTARAMAMAAFQRALKLQAAGEGAGAPAIGIGCTASLASDRPKRGPHRVHVALQTAARTATLSLELEKGQRTRSEEEDVAAALVLCGTAEAMQVDMRLALALAAGEAVESIATEAPRAWQDLLLGRTQAAKQGSAAAQSAAPEAVFPGAFNPLHQGHVRMAEIAAARLHVPVAFEISIENVDKPPLDYTEMAQRAAQFEDTSRPLWFTRAATFEDKSRVFPGATFIVGADTLARIGEPRYYGGDAGRAAAAIERIARQGCRFLVFGRAVDGRFETLSDLELPGALRAICEEVPAGEFREDISSTALRQQAREA